MSIQTMACDIQYKTVQEFKKTHDNQFFSKCGLEHKNGNLVPWSQLFSARDGCEIFRILGYPERCQCPQHLQSFIIKSESSGKPLPNIEYLIKAKSGSPIIGKTNENGETDIFYSDEAEVLEITVLHPR